MNTPTATIPGPLTEAQLQEARGWILDCQWTARDTDAHQGETWDESLTDADVTVLVARHYDGGLNAFRLAN